jgi:hypothetical protein
MKSINFLSCLIGFFVCGISSNARAHLEIRAESFDGLEVFTISEDNLSSSARIRRLLYVGSFESVIKELAFGPRERIARAPYFKGPIPSVIMPYCTVAARNLEGIDVFSLYHNQRGVPLVSGTKEKIREITRLVVDISMCGQGVSGLELLN